MNEPSSDAAPTRRAWLVLAGVVVVATAAALRFFRLGEWSYWIDEAHTISDANALVSGDVSAGFAGHRLSFFLYGAAFAAARALGLGFDETIARALPAFFGVASVALTLWAGARAAGAGAACLAALLVALSPFQIYWSQNARSYALEVMVAIPAVLFFGRGLALMLPGWLTAGAILLVLAAAAHPTALAVVPPLVVFAWVARRFVDRPVPTRAVIFVAASAVILGAAFLLSPLGRSVRLHFLVKPHRSPGLFLSTVAFYFRPALLAAGAFLAVHGFLRRDARSALLSLAAFGTLAAGFAASLVARTNAQYVIVAFPFLALLIGREIAIAAREGRGAPRIAAIALAAALVADQAAGAFLYFGPEHGHRAYWREASAFVWKNAAPADAIASTQSPVVECYLNPSNRRPRDAAASIYLGPYEPEQVDLLLRQRRTTWFLILDVDLEEWAPVHRARFRRILREECRLVAEWPLQFAGRDQSIRVWRHDPE